MTLKVAAQRRIIAAHACPTCGAVKGKPCQPIDAFDPKLDVGLSYVHAARVRLSTPNGWR